MKRISIPGVMVVTMFLCACNPAYEDITDNICNSLHPVKPVSKDIKVTDYCHGESFRFPYKWCTEAQCHGPDLKGGNSGAPSCYKCHSDRWAIFSTTHTFKIKYYYHHNLVESGNFTTNCGASGVTPCHGASLTGVAGYGYSCYLCHNPIPIPGHTVNYGGHKHHRLVLTASIYNDLYLSSYCGSSSCHGADLKGIATLSGPGPSCFTVGCHTHVPNPATDLPAPGHTRNFEGQRHHYKVGSQPESWCTQAGCHTHRSDARPCSDCHD